MNYLLKDQEDWLARIRDSIHKSNTLSSRGPSLLSHDSTSPSISTSISSRRRTPSCQGEEIELPQSNQVNSDKNMTKQGTEGCLEGDIENKEGSLENEKGGLEEKSDSASSDTGEGKEM